MGAGEAGQRRGDAWYAAGHAEAIQRTKEDFPYLRYSASLDARVRHDHAILDGIILPVDDPFWKSYMPPWDFNCRCSVIQRRSGRRSAPSEPRASKAAR